MSETSEAIDQNIRWVPFGALALALLVASGFWKIEKNRENPIQPLQVQDSRIAKKPGAQIKLEGKLAPAFSLPTYDGKTMTLSDYRGKIVFLNIWATWCPPCREEMPSMQRLHEHFIDNDFAMLTISIDEKTADIEPFMKELGLTFPVAIDPKQVVVSQYGITGVPETYLIDKNGIVIHHLVGPGEWDTPEIFSALEQLISR